jgi:hypothetical protein
MDFMTGLPPTKNGHTAYLSITCRLSNLLQVGFCSDTVTAEQAARPVFEHWVVHYGLPAVIISDRDPRFTGKFWQALWKLLDTQLHMSTAATGKEEYRFSVRGARESNPGQIIIFGNRPRSGLNHWPSGYKPKD